MTIPLLCEVFRSTRREGMYLYVERGKDLEDLPETLRSLFGDAQSVLVFRLHPERRLARASAAEVLEAISAQGYFLQLPPADPYSSEGGATIHAD